MLCFLRERTDVQVEDVDVCREVPVHSSIHTADAQASRILNRFTCLQNKEDFHASIEV